jgi:hypothetical protein
MIIDTRCEPGTTRQLQEEINRLKENWLSDPCWDIEMTEGFETHYIELKAFRLEHEMYAQAEYILVLEQKIKTLTEKVYELDETKAPIITFRDDASNLE